jgi:virulence factor Mce-like protein
MRAELGRGGLEMINRRLIVNLVVFFVVSFALVAYGIVNLLGNPLQSPTMLTTQFADASGLYPGFVVELNGVPVGTVTSTALTRTATKVTMRINPGTSVPDDVQSSVQIANDLGEQVVNLVPSRGGAAPALAGGAEVPAAPNQVPANVGAVVASATRLLKAIPGGDLNKLIGELAISLAGQAGNLRTLISAGTTFSKEFVAYQQQFTELLANAPPSLDAITAVAPELRQDLANTAALVQVLAQQKTGLHTLLTSGSSAFNAVDELLTSQSANLGCFLHDSADILSNIAQPTNLNNLSQGLAYNTYFFGAVDHIAVQGVAKPTTTSGSDTNQTFLRTRLLIPPVLDEQAQSYGSSSSIPNTLPGAGCVTAFGNGVGPATQPGFTPAAVGHVVAPTAQEANVEVASATPVGQVASASYRVPADRMGLLLCLGGLVVPALFLAWGARPARRRTRRRA